MPARPRPPVEYVPFSLITRAEDNPKRHDLPDIVASIREHGFVEPLVIDTRTSRLVGGEGRLDALELIAKDPGPDGPPKGIYVTARGVWHAPVWYVESRDDADAAHLLVALNGGGRAGWDEDRLGALLDRIRQERPLEGTGFDDDAVDRLLADVAGDTDDRAVELGPDPDAVPDDAPPVTIRGDVWVLGRHRLLCGDSTKSDTYRQLLGDDRPALMVTDPPYGVSYQSASTKRAILGDLSQATIPVSLAASIDHLDPDGRVVMFGGSDQFAMYVSLFDHHLRQQPRVVVWVKEGFVMRHHGFHSRFELAYYGWRGSGGAAWWGPRNVSDVWEVARTRDTDHDTEKPCALFEIPISHLAGPGDLILDPFAGSGVAIIAAERTGRTARAVELDPHWCDVICLRWQRATGQVPVLEGRWLKGENGGPAVWDPIGTGHDFTDTNSSTDLDSQEVGP